MGAAELTAPESTSTRFASIGELVDLSRLLGLPEHDLVILAEGNTSARTANARLAVKASGARLDRAEPGDFVEVAWEPVLAAIRDETISNDDVPAVYARATDAGARAPSTEAFIHAIGHGVCGATWVAHTHPTAVVSLLSSALDDEDIRRPLFPDEAVVAEVEPAIVDYVDPGIELGRAVLRAVEDYQDRRGRSPRTVLLRNHGLVAFGGSADEVAAASLMATKGARVRLGAIAAGGLKPLPEGAAEHLVGRLDEQARQSALFGHADTPTGR